jgi:hypothetical protein
MKLPVAAALCDALEIGSLQLGRSLTKENAKTEATQGITFADPDELVRDAFALAARRAAFCPRGYPFYATPRILRARRQRRFNEYLFLLIGSVIRYENGLEADELKRRFRKYFEDFVCWTLKMNGNKAYVLSEPRRERGLDKSLIPALRQVGKTFHEFGTLLHEQVTEDDNDLGVDVIATPKSIDASRSGRPVFLIQCATGPPAQMRTKITEKQEIFCGVWNESFYRVLSIRGAATPDDLLNLEPIFWHRLCQHGWVLDRMRLVRLVRDSTGRRLRLPASLTTLWEDLVDFIDEID